MLKSLKEMLVCPDCHSILDWTNERVRNNYYIVSAQITCENCHRRYFVEDEIAYFLTDLNRNDLWEEADSGLMKFLKEQPSLYNQLMTSPLESLSPADIFFKSMILEEQSEFHKADEMRDIASKKIYTSEHFSCSTRQIEYICNLKIPENKPILDIASGKGYLAFKLLAQTKNHIIFTDFSPVIMKKNKKKLSFLNLLNKTSLLVFDARKTPFKDQSIDYMTSNQGLGNIEEPTGLLTELRRILRGDFFSIMMFLPETDSEHHEFIQKNGLSNFMFLDYTQEEFSKAKFTSEILNSCKSSSKPTPRGKLIPSGIDGIPIHDTIISWATFHAK